MALVGISLGIAGALRTGIMGRVVDTIALVGLAIPDFLLGLILVAWFAVAIELFPATGYVPFEQSPSDWLRSLVLPVITLAVPSIAVVAKQTRDAMREVLEEPVHPHAARIGDLEPLDRLQARAAQRRDPGRHDPRHRLHRRPQRHRDRRVGVRDPGPRRPRGAGDARSTTCR